MLFRPLDIPGLFLIELERKEDERGFFFRLFCTETFLQHGLCADYPQWSVSFNERRGTVRGLHFQAPPHEETKLVSCTHGAVFDVAVDLRPHSPSRGRWIAVELSAENRIQWVADYFNARGLVRFGTQARRDDEPAALVADMAKVERILGRHAPTSIESGLERLLRKTSASSPALNSWRGGIGSCAS
jgi:dTDP-4-dehydrorhamnose 3,5-epimerase